MTVTTQGSRAILDGNAVTQTFSASFELPAAGDLIVWRQDTDSSTTALTSNLYTLAGVGSETGFTIDYLQGGTTILTTGQSLILIRDVPNTQPTTLTNNGPFDATDVMDALDNLEFQIQQQTTVQGLTLRIPFTDAAIPEFPDAAARADSFAFFDSSGNPTTASATAGISSTISVGTVSSTASATEILFAGSGLTSVTFSGTIATVTVAGGGGGTPGGTNGQIQFNNSSAFGGFTVGGDGTLSTAGALVVTKTGGVAFASLATLAAGGDMTGSTNSTTLTLKTVNASPGTFAQANITVNAKGLVTTASTGSTGASISITDGAHTASGVTTISFTGATVTTASPTGSVTVTGGGGGGGLVFLEAHTAATSASMIFTQISSTYANYAIEIEGLIPTADGTAFLFQFSTDSGSTFIGSSSYTYEAWTYTNSGSNSENLGATGQTTMQLCGSQHNDVNALPYVASLRLMNPLSTTLSKWIFGTAAWNAASVVVTANYSGMILIPGTAYNAFKIYPASSTIASGTVRLYGLAKS